MNNLTKIAAISVVVLSAVYAFTTINSGKPPKKIAVDSTSIPKKAEQPAPPQIKAQQQYLAPPSIDKPSKENLSASAKPSPQTAPRMAPPPPILPSKTANAQHQETQGHGHEHQQSATKNNSQPPPRGADL